MMPDMIQLKKYWDKPSYDMDKLQTNVDCVIEEYEYHPNNINFNY